MELVRVLWIFIFLFLALILIFTWSKMVIISGKIRSITGLLDSITNNSKSGVEKEEQAAMQPNKNQTQAKKV